MTKYFIESPDGKWLTEPDSEESLTDNPFKAWAFEELREPLKWLYKTIQSVAEEKYSWPIPDNKPGSYMLQELQEEECLEGYKITKHEFVQERGEMIHRREIRDTGAYIDIHESGTIIKNYGNVKEVYLPAWDGPLEDYFKPLKPLSEGLCTWSIFNI